MVNRVVVLGGGSAGFIAALTLKVKLPELEVLVLRSKDIGIIGVGEGTTSAVPKHFHVYLKVNTHEFYRLAQPIWKLGIHFLWGPRPCFNYVFGYQFFSRYAVLPKHTGYYCDEDITDATLTSGLMDRDLCFPRRR